MWSYNDSSVLSFLFVRDTFQTFAHMGHFSVTHWTNISIHAMLAYISQARIIVIKDFGQNEEYTCADECNFSFQESMASYELLFRCFTFGKSYPNYRMTHKGAVTCAVCPESAWLVTFLIGNVSTGVVTWSALRCGASGESGKKVAAAPLSKTAAAAAAAKTWFAKHPLDYMLHNRFPWKRSGRRSSMWPPYSLRRNLSAAACRPCDRSLNRCEIAPVPDTANLISLHGVLKHRCLLWRKTELGF